MNSQSSTAQQPKTSTADRMLASIRRGADMPADSLKKLGVEQPIMASVPAAEPVNGAGIAETDEVSTHGSANRRQKTTPSQSGAVQRKMDFDVSTGRGVKHLTIRVPKEVAADLSLLAMRNKLSENGEPTTINELGLKAFKDLLRRTIAA